MIGAFSAWLIHTGKVKRVNLKLAKNYRMAGNFRRVRFSWMVDLYHFVGLIFTDTCTHAHYVLYNPTYFVGLIFVARGSSAKTMKIGPRKIFPLYGIKIT